MACILGPEPEKTKGSLIDPSFRVGSMIQRKFWTQTLKNKKPLDLYPEVSSGAVMEGFEPPTPSLRVKELRFIWFPEDPIMVSMPLFHDSQNISVVDHRSILNPLIQSK
jgi:hypothetical protein